MAEEEKNQLLHMKQEKIEEIKRAQKEKENLNAKINVCTPRIGRYTTHVQ